MKRCQFFLRHKNRCCKFEVLPGKEYCGQHLYLVTGEGRKRIPCPLNPAHTVAEEDLERHLRKCQALIRLEDQRRDSTFSVDINRPVVASPDLPKGTSRSECRSAYVETLGWPGLKNLITKVEEVYADMEKPELAYHIPEECRPFLQPDGRRPFKLKHALQQSSLIGNMINKDVFKDDPPLVIEFGAGKAYLSSMISDATSSQSFVLVDNQRFKLKAERTMKADKRLSVRRVCSDLKDFDLTRLEELERGLPWVAIGKHLCGSSSDYAILCFHQAAKLMPSRGLFIATCCHHRCEWESFSAKEVFLDFGFSPEDFEVISWMTGWALCDHQADSIALSDDLASKAMELEVDTEDRSVFWRFLPKEFREAIGMKCKILIDKCRSRWLELKGYESEISLYVPEDVSPENKLLSAI